ncbi:MAG: redoxin domain-containing protein [Tepidiformaceae bacterium]
MASTETQAPPMAPGSMADFELPAGPEETVRTSDFRGQPVILAFYPADWSPVCSDQMALYQEVKPLFDEYNAQLLGISVDGIWCHKAFAESRHLEFPLLADFEPKGCVSRAYQSYNNSMGMSERALFVLDKDGAVYWSYTSPATVNPGADGILAALEEMKQKGAA